MPKADQAERLVELENQVDKIEKQDYNRIHEEYSDLIQWLMMFYNTKHKIITISIIIILQYLFTLHDRMIKLYKLNTLGLFSLILSVVTISITAKCIT